MVSKTLSKSLGLVACMFFLECAAQAQTVAGSISGLVTDTSGAAITDATVTVTDIDRSVVFKGNSNESGFYLVSPVPPGRYRIEAEKAGFRRFVIETYPIATQQKAGVDIRLDVGAVSESVTVSSSAQLVETTTATLSGVVENKRIIDLPLNGRNVYGLAALTPGVFGMSPAAGNGGVGEGFESIGRFTVNGGRDSSNAIMMDGVPVTMNSNTANMNANSAVPTIEGVEEFRIQTNSYSAEYGRSGGGVLTIATKSGTNEFHGSLFEFLRNSKMDANNYFSNASNRPLGVFQRNEYGGSIGGPIIRNKTFFFTAYESRAQRSAVNNFYTLPTDLQMQGDFSQTFNAQGQQRVIFDPFSTAPDPARPGQFLRTPFPGNRIPAERLDPVALNVQKYYGPRPNLPGLAFTGANNFFFQGKYKADVNRGTAKVDHNFNEKQKLFVRYSIFDNQNAQPTVWDSPGCPDGACFANAERQQNAALDYTNTISSNSILNLRYGFARSILNRQSNYVGFKPSQLGLPANVETGADILAFPEFTVEEMTMPGVLHHWNFRSANMSHTFIGTYSKLLSNHNLKIGSEFRSNLINHSQAPWSMNYTFTRGMTTGPDARLVSGAAGFAYASFLLGAGSSGSVVNGIRPALESKSFGVYIQDDWKVNRKLTLNLGLRWDMETGMTERYDRYAAFDPNVRSPLSDKVGLDLKGGYIFPNDGIDGRGLRSAQLGNFAPRVGIAYQVLPNTVIRTGYGIFYTMAPYGANNYGTAPFRASTPWLTSLDGVTPYNLLRNPYPEGVLVPEGSANGLLAALGQGVGAPVQDTLKTPYNQQWNFTISQQVGSSMGIEIGYAGNKGTLLPLSWQYDQLRLDQMTPDAGLLDLVPNPFYGTITVGPLSTPTVQRGHLLTPFPQYPGVSYAGVSHGNSNFHALQAKVEKRFQAGSNVVVAYTWSKLISDGGDNAWTSAGFRDNYCRACDRSISPYNQPHRLVASFTYELPFGQGKSMGANWNGFVNAILGNWQVNGIGTLNSGLPIQINNPANNSFSFGGGQRPDSNGQEARLDDPTIARWFDTSAFSIAPNYTFGNLGRVHPNLKTDTVENFDFSIFKNFRIGERYSVQFRGEWFNIANHPIFGAPANTVGAGNFGAVTSQANSPRQTQLALKFLF
ncbi:MAG TPA: TonB-dependent receptor [Bryobacteraceae bacterium]|nr:TonB-dependent receptor [Bryobacteraceae bacterium]